ncbi:hypothetical protein HK097_010026 [Rhizophlyctis rosea]|uniref:Enoyl reductase (ER) domain-containing protein n=1 Tax=Rhizophlyctis rosea TaxID=64517 RepID=A0AAD5SPG7_9FUNG|nr:hypothetical protein HK097_010026 [Rhizophlyctis rosea]
MVKALLIKQLGPIAENTYVADFPTPSPGEGEVIVKVHAAAINPADWKLAESTASTFHKSFPAPFGFDISGTITEVGPGISGFAVGDEVFGVGQYAFAEFVKAKATRLNKKPSNLSHPQSSTLWVGLATSIAALYSPLGHSFPPPSSNQSFFRPEWLLITGGATSVGLYCIQLAAASGYSVITTASPQHTSLLQQLGALHVIDYHQPRDEVIRQIKEASHNRLSYVIDIVGDTETAVGALSDKPNATLVSITGRSEKVREGVNVKDIQTLNPQIEGFIKELIDGEVVEYLEQGRIQPNNVQIVEGGLEGVKEALRLSKEGNVNASKLVVPLV